jgi:hypothetical protein
VEKLALVIILEWYATNLSHLFRAFHVDFSFIDTKAFFDRLFLDMSVA